MSANNDIDITDSVYFGGNDDECLPLEKCACGHKFGSWDFTLGIYRDSPKECPNCHRLLYFGVMIRVYEIGNGEI